METEDYSYADDNGESDDELDFMEASNSLIKSQDDEIKRLNEKLKQALKKSSKKSKDGISARAWASIGVCVLASVSMYVTGGETGIGWGILGLMFIWG